MTPITVLKEEHQLIREALENLSLAKEKLESGVRPPLEFFEKALEFIRSFVQKFHHFKEEHVMFERLAEKKNGALDGQIDSLRYQHERGRDLIITMADALMGYNKEQEIQTSNLLENLASYISLLRQHLHNEEHIFYPLAETMLTSPENQALMGIFKQEEEKIIQKGGGNARDLIREMGNLLHK